MNENDYRYWAEKRLQRKRVIPWWAYLIAFILLCCVVMLLEGCSSAATPKPASKSSSNTEYVAVMVTATNQVVATATAMPSPTVARCIVSTGYKGGTVNVRSGPGMNYPVITVVKEGDYLWLSGNGVKEWREVTTPNKVTGFFYVERWCK